MALTRDQILGSDDLPREAVDVPLWGGEVFVRAFMGEQRQEFKNLAIQHEAGDVDELDLVALLVIATTVGDDGELLFTPDDLPALKKKNADALVTVGNVALRINGLTEESIENITGNSHSGQS